ncbi:related to BAR domain protein [Ustilago trichophora]|uniref:Related to BAR domain protein n=1 Tax=Ustilago trichophora TaxID=86804 RepID=A0A5C3ET22_9BASI|nr:related to BAR domain protein [Ustilago trichophora]
MDQWKKFANNVTSNVGPQFQNIGKTFGNLNQQARERFGAVDQEDITELPQEYKDLERRVDALKNVHTGLIKVAKVYETESYDYPTQLQESITQLSATVGHSVTSWAASATRGTNLPKVSPTARPQKVNKTLHHALSRAAASGALQLGADPSNLSGLPNLDTATAPGSEPAPKDDSKLGEALQKFAIAEDRLGNARLTQDDQITQGFNVPFNSFGAQIQLAMKARQSVTDARLHLDSWRQSLKSAENAGAAAKLEQYRTEVEQAEDKLVAATEEAISLMKQVLENPEPIKSLSAFVKAQAEYHAAAAQLLSSVQQELAQLATSVESDYRLSRG